MVPRKNNFPDFDKILDSRDGGGTITTVELGQVLLQMFNAQVGNCNGQVMRTFGWSPSEGELQELVGEIDQVLSFNNARPCTALMGLLGHPTVWVYKTGMT